MNVDFIESMDICKNAKTPDGWVSKPDGIKCNRHLYVGVIGESRLVYRVVKKK